MAITAVHYQPHTWSPAYNPIIWSFTSDLSSEVDMNYVVDLYINGATGYTYRLKQRPNPAGKCMVDISTIMQSYINLTDYTAEKGYTLPYKDSSDIVASVMIKVGETYDDDGVLVYKDGMGGTGDPLYAIYSNETAGLTSDKAVRVLPMALDYYDSLSSMESIIDNGYLAPYIMGGTGEFLKRDSNNITLGSTDYHTLSFLNWWDEGAGTYQTTVQGMEVSSYSDSGIISSTFYGNIQSQGGGPQTSLSYTSTTQDRAYDMLTFKCGPADLTLPSGTTYYTVKAYFKDSATTSTDRGSVASELVTFTLDTNCQDLYDVVRLSWLNDLGGRDYYNFNMFYEKTTKGKQETYFQHTYDWSGTVPVVLSNDADSSKNWLRGGEKIYNKQIIKDIRIETDWLDQTKINFLAGIPESSSVWAYVGDDQFPYTLTVDNLTYSYKNVKQQKLVQAKINATITKINIKQNI